MQERGRAGEGERARFNRNSLLFSGRASGARNFCGDLGVKRARERERERDLGVKTEGRERDLGVKRERERRQGLQQRVVVGLAEGCYTGCVPLVLEREREREKEREGDLY